MRLIAEAGRALARVRQLLFGGDAPAAAEAIRQSAAQAGVDLDVLRVLTPETASALLVGNKPDALRCAQLALFLTADLLLLEAGDSHELVDLRRRQIEALKAASLRDEDANRANMARAAWAQVEAELAVAPPPPNR